MLAGPAADAPAAAAPAADATTLDRLVVRPQLEAQVRAIDLKRDSNAILDAVAADDVGDYPDQNVAESVSRLPGVSVTRDQGEGRYVVVRGLDAALNSVTIDGIAIGTTESDNRATPLDLIPSDSTERLKVVKSPTPDMPGDSIGGAIEVESASAFDRDGRSLRGRIEADHQQLSGHTSPRAAFNYSERFADDTFGVALGLNYQDRKFESDNTEGEYDALDSGELFMVQQQRRKYFIERKRWGANLNLDWRPDADNRYYLRTLYSDYQDAETRQNTVIDFDPDTVVARGDGTYLAPVDDLSKRVRFRTKKENTAAASFGGENRLSGAVLDYQVGYTRTEERVPDEQEARFKITKAAKKGLTASIDQTDRLPDIDFSSERWADNANYAFNKWVLSPGSTDDKEVSAKINARFDGDHASYKMGLLGRFRDRDVDKNEPELSKGPAIDPTTWTVAAPEHRHNSLGQALSSSAMRAYLGAERRALQRRRRRRGQQRGRRAGRGLHLQGRHPGRLRHGHLGHRRAARDRRRARGEHQLHRHRQQHRDPGRRVLQRHAAEGPPQLHQRAAGAAPALGRRGGLDAARGVEQDRLAARVRPDRAARDHRPRRRAGRAGQSRPRPLRIDQSGPVLREVSGAERHRLAGPVPQVDRRLHRRHGQQQRPGLRRLRRHPRHQRR